MNISILSVQRKILCRCEYKDIILKMERILCPEGVVIFRDAVDPLIKVKQMARESRHEVGSQVS